MKILRWILFVTLLILSLPVAIASAGFVGLAWLFYKILNFTLSPFKDKIKWYINDRLN